MVISPRINSCGIFNILFKEQNTRRCAQQLSLWTVRLLAKFIGWGFGRVNLNFNLFLCLLLAIVEADDEEDEQSSPRFPAKKIIEVFAQDDKEKTADDSAIVADVSHVSSGGDEA